MTISNSLTPYIELEGKNLSVTSTRISSTSIKITWTPPKEPKAYAGALIIGSLTDLNPSNFPTDSVHYTASSNFNQPQNQIGRAYVLGAFYDDLTTKELLITNLPENEPIFVSIHLATNVYRYYAQGQKAYAEDGLSSAFAGHIETSYQPPDNPISGQVYFDPVQKTVFAYDGQKLVWLPVSAHTSITGDFDPEVTLESVLKTYIGIGNGLINNIASGSNAIIETWTVMQSVNPLIFTITGSISGIKPSAQLGIPYNNGLISFTINTGSTSFSPGDTFNLETIGKTITVGLPIGYPKTGDFFYNTMQKKLKCWSGTSWILSETDRGEPTYQKLGIGTNGESYARDNIKDILKHQLGYPMVCVELKEHHFDIAIDNALQELRRRTDIAYYKQYIFMQMMKDQDVYYLNDPTKETDRIVDVVKVHRLNMLGLSNFGPDNIQAQQFMTQFYAPGVGYDLISVHLIHSLSETYSNLFAGDIAHLWREARRELRLMKRINANEKVLLECSMEKPEQELLVDRWAQQWIQAWAEAEAMFILAHIRGKFQSLPGPGGISMNGSELMSEGQRLQEDCLRSIKDFEVGQNGPDNFYTPILIG